MRTRTCYRMTQYEGQPIIRNERGKAFVERLCVICGNPFLAKVDHLRIGYGQACSLPCRGLLGRGLKTRRRNRIYKLIYRPDHPRARKGTDAPGFVPEHVIVAEEVLGRYLQKGEVVHHLNGKKHDNRPENLEVMKNMDHVRLHAVRGSVPCRFCGRI